ncbi:nicotinamide mononucleotide transporter family protein [Oerskovia sp. M15]
MDLIHALFDAQLTIGGQHLLWREIVGNGFGLASALGACDARSGRGPWGSSATSCSSRCSWVQCSRRPTRQPPRPGGRQVMFVIVSVYGWVQWRRTRARLGQDTAGVDADSHGVSVEPRWATWRQRGFLVVALVGGTIVLTPIFRMLESYEPVWADAWIFMGSLLATYGMAKGWVEFWLIWVAVDVVGVPCWSTPASTRPRSCTCSTGRSPSSGSSCGGGSTAAPRRGAWQRPRRSSGLIVPCRSFRPRWIPEGFGVTWLDNIAGPTIPE